jgi:DNA-binding MarR family transcriptional regulator
LDWLDQLARLADIIQRNLRQHWELSLDEYRVLVLLDCESLVQKRIACDAGRSSSAVSRWVEQFRRMGCVAVNRSENNGGWSTVSLTRHGRNRLK